VDESVGFPVLSFRIQGYPTDRWINIAASFYRDTADVLVVITDPVAVTCSIPFGTTALADETVVVPVNTLSIATTVEDSVGSTSALAVVSALAITTTVPTSVGSTSALATPAVVAVTLALPIATVMAGKSVVIPVNPCRIYVDDLSVTATIVNKIRLIGFVYSPEAAYMMEFGHLYIRFYKDGEYLGDTLELVTPYTQDHLFELQIKQVADTMWIVHPEHAPRKLTRVSPTLSRLMLLSSRRGHF
jgi:hypothetical protein